MNIQATNSLRVNPTTYTPNTSRQYSAATKTSIADQVSISQAAYDRASSEVSAFRINDSLTEKDKSLVVSATGSLQPTSASGLHEVNQLATHIALERQTGRLSGMIDKTYINRLIQEQQSSQQPTIPSAVLNKALALLDQMSSDG